MMILTIIKAIAHAVMSPAFQSLYPKWTLFENQHKLDNSFLLENVTIYYNATGCVPVKLYLAPGSYGLEVVGAAGGDTTYSYGGYGGRSYGELTISEPTYIFVNTGQKGENTRTLSGNACNGGGSAIGDLTYDHGAGGGSTDIRIGDNDLLHRVIVAGGGGGAGYEEGENGGYGGGLIGGNGQGKFGCGRGAQEVWCSEVCMDGYSNCHPGILLYGGNSSSTERWQTGGGGGLIGGAGSAFEGSSGGGSGYTFNETSRKDSNITLLESKYFLRNAFTEKFDNREDGYAKITILKKIPTQIADSFLVPRHFNAFLMYSFLSW